MVVVERCVNVRALSDAQREELILKHIPLLKHLVGRVAVDLPSSVDRDDLYGFGMLGLIGAADTWDQDRGLKFSTFAYARIRGAMLDELRKLDFLPRGRRDKVRNVERAVSQLEQENGVPPAPEELAAHLEISLDDLDEVLVSAKTALETSLDEGPNVQLGRLLCDPSASAPEDAIGRAELLQAMTAAVAELPEQEKSVITLYYAEELLLREISSLLGVTESRVSQIHTRALYRLNRALAPLVGDLEA
jgi:RNA polymerase sigma factor for flagellar operon FliA